MDAKGREQAVGRQYTAAEKAHILEHAAAHGVTETALQLGVSR